MNGQLDSNFSRLEEAGLGSVALAEKLAAALARIGELEDEIRALILEGKDREEGREGLVRVYKQRQAKRYVFPARQLGVVVTSLAGSRTSNSNKKGFIIGKLTNSDADKERLQDALAEVHEQLSTMQGDNTRERSRLIADVTALKRTLAEQNETSEKEIERMRLETIDALDAAYEDVEKAKQDAIASTRETVAARVLADEAQRRVGALEKELEKVKHEYDDLHRRHVRAAADSVPTWELQQKESTIKRLQVNLDSARADADASAARLARECSLLRKAEQEIESLKKERERVMRDIKAFDADLILQTTEARRLREQLLVLKDNDSAVQRFREELAGLRAEREAERVRGKEEVQRVKREVGVLKEEVEGLERWKVEHACGAYV